MSVLHPAEIYDRGEESYLSHVRATREESGMPATAEQMLEDFTDAQLAAAIRAAYTWIGRLPITPDQCEAAARAKINLGPVLAQLERRPHA